MPYYPHFHDRDDDSHNPYTPFLNISKMSLKQLIIHQDSFRKIISQIQKLKLIHTDSISKDIFNCIIEECNQHLPIDERK